MSPPSSIPTGGGAFVPVTLNEIYGEVVGTRSEVRDLTHSVRDIATQSADHEQRMRHQEQTAATREQVDALQKAFDPRIVALERWRWTAGGVIVVLSTTGGAFLGKLISKS